MSEQGQDRSARSREFQDAVNRLEKAVHDLVGTAGTQFSDRATAFIDETTRRLERELGRKQARGSRGTDPGGTDADGEGTDDPLYERYQPRSRTRVETRSRRLYRDPRQAKIGGVCAGIAAYYGVENWVVRCIAVTALLFFPSIVFPAYWIAYFVLDPMPGSDDERRSGRSSRRRARRDRWRGYADSARHNHGSPAPELGARLSPRTSLRNVQADLTEVELRLRRMETHVTSGQYELQRELNKIDGR
ncbi:MAG: PspC domain-containing protein [Pseudomonadales bacterium]